MMYGVTLPLRVVGYEGDLADVVEPVVEQLAELDEGDERLLDFAVDSDATDDTAQVQVTVDVPSLEEAVVVAIGYVRTAIHTVGGRTPGWDDRETDGSGVSYTVDDEESVAVRVLTDAW